MTDPAPSRVSSSPCRPCRMIDDLLLGFTAATFAKTLLAPLERAKLLLMIGVSQRKAPVGTPLDDPTNPNHIAKPYRGILDMIRRTSSERGLLFLWRGNAANVWYYAPLRALNFMFKNMYKEPLDLLSPPGSTSRLVGNLFAGGAAGALPLAIVYPFDFARTRLAQDAVVGKAREFTGILDCIRKTASKGGWSGQGGVYHGFAISCAGVAVHRAAYFGLYDSVCETSTMRDAGFGSKFATAYGATLAAGFLSYPLDMVRRRWMMSFRGSRPSNNNSALDCARQVIADQGFRALYRGAGATIMRSFTGAIVLVAFDYGKKFYLQRKHQQINALNAEV